MSCTDWLFAPNVWHALISRLDIKTLGRLGVNTARYRSYEYAATYAVAAAAGFLGHDGLVVPNARHPGLNLVGNLEAAVEVVSSEPMDLSAWR